MRFLSRYPDKGSNSGFTIVEILVVVAIMATFSTIAIPSFHKWRSSLRYHYEALSISSELRLGRDLAITNNLESRLEFDIDGRRHRLVKGNLSSGSTAWSAETPWDELDAEVSWATGTGCDSTADMSVTFKPNGSSTGATLCITDSAGAERFKVTVSSISGRVRVE